MNKTQKEYSTKLILFLKENNGYASNDELKSVLDWFKDEPRHRDVLTENLKAGEYIQQFGNSNGNFMLLPKGWAFESWKEEEEQKIIQGKLDKSTIDLNSATITSFNNQKLLGWAAITISGVSLIIALINLNSIQKVDATIRNHETQGIDIKILDLKETDISTELVIDTATNKAKEKNAP